MAVPQNLPSQPQTRPLAPVPNWDKTQLPLSPSRAPLSSIASPLATKQVFSPCPLLSVALALLKRQPPKDPVHQQRCHYPQEWTAPATQQLSSGGFPNAK